MFETITPSKVKTGFNRYIVECKFRSPHLKPLEIGDLIDT